MFVSMHVSLCLVLGSLLLIFHPPQTVMPLRVPLRLQRVVPRLPRLRLEQAEPHQHGRRRHRSGIGESVVGIRRYTLPVIVPAFDLRSAS